MINPSWQYDDKVLYFWIISYLPIAECMWWWEKYGDQPK